MTTQADPFARMLDAAVLTESPVFPFQYAPIVPAADSSLALFFGQIGKATGPLFFLFWMMDVDSIGVGCPQHHP